MIGRNADVRGSLLQHLEHGLQHAGHRAERAVLPLVEAAQAVEVPEELVRPVDDVNDHPPLCRRHGPSDPGSQPPVIPPLAHCQSVAMGIFLTPARRSGGDAYVSVPPIRFANGTAGPVRPCRASGRPGPRGVIVGDASAPSAAIAKTLFPTPLVQAEADAVRLLEQATFGPNDASITHVMDMGAALWVEQQLSMPPTRYTAFTPWPATRPDTCVNDSTLPLTPTSYCQRDNYTLFQLQREFFVNALTAPDQLETARGVRLVADPRHLGHRDQSRVRDAAVSADSFRPGVRQFPDMLTQVTLSPAMGRYLDMVNNLKPNLTTGVEPNENYARELLQLFSLGTVELGLDGAPLLDS